MLHVQACVHLIVKIQVLARVLGPWYKLEYPFSQVRISEGSC